MTIYLCAKCADKLGYTDEDSTGVRVGKACENCGCVPSMWPRLQITIYRLKETEGQK